MFEGKACIEDVSHIFWILYSILMRCIILSSLRTYYNITMLPLACLKEEAVNKYHMTMGTQKNEKWFTVFYYQKRIKKIIIILIAASYVWTYTVPLETIITFIKNDLFQLHTEWRGKTQICTKFVMKERLFDLLFKIIEV